jgi:hypothetical protein
MLINNRNESNLVPALTITRQSIPIVFGGIYDLMSNPPTGIRPCTIFSNLSFINMQRLSLDSLSAVWYAIV